MPSNIKQTIAITLFSCRNFNFPFQSDYYFRQSTLFWSVVSSWVPQKRTFIYNTNYP